jgi:hypothetical membrane protein
MQLGCALIGRLRAEWLARFTLAGIVVYVAIDVLLAFLRPGYSLLHNAESDYGRGPWFWVMDVNFLLRCALSLALVGALYRSVHPQDRPRGGLRLLTAWAVCSGLLAFFADDPAGYPRTGSGQIHVLLGLIAFVGIAAGAIVVSVKLRAGLSQTALSQTALSQTALSRAALPLAVAGAAALVLFVVTAGHKHAPGGLYERVFLGIELLWMAAAAARVVVRRPQPVPVPVPA